jgi:hypothetical protein
MFDGLGTTTYTYTQVGLLASEDGPLGNHAEMIAGKDHINQIFATLFLGLLVQALILLGLGLAFHRRLKLKHPAVWEALGRPAFWPARIGGSLRSARYILKAEYRSTQDKAFIRLGTIHRIAGIVYWLYFIAFLMVALFLLLQ